MKKLKELLQGKWLGHPVHPVLAHVPMGLWPMACLVDLLSLLGLGGNVLVRTSFYLILGGLVVIPLAVPTGLALWWEVGRDKPAWKVGLFHMLITGVASIVWLVNLFVRAGDVNSERVATGPFLLSIVGTLLVVGGGYLGGRMVYNYGVFVGWYSLEKLRREAAAGHARLPEQEK